MTSKVATDLIGTLVLLWDVGLSGNIELNHTYICILKALDNSDRIEFCSRHGDFE